MLSPQPATSPLPNLTVECDQAAPQVVANQIAQLDRAEIGSLTASADVSDGHWPVSRRAVFDSATLCGRSWPTRGLVGGPTRRCGRDPVKFG